MSTEDGGIVQIAMPALMRVFRAPFPTVQWVALGYLMEVTSTTIGATRRATREGVGVDPAHASAGALTLSLHETLHVSAVLAAAALALAIVAWRRDRSDAN